MILITIKAKYGMVVCLQGRNKGSRLEWIAANQFEFYLEGAFSPLDYDSARNLALQTIIGAHLPAIALKRVSRPKRQSKKSQSETKGMFS